MIPAVGDLAGSTALPAIARFFRERGQPLSAYYVSNVDYYVAGEGKIDAFMENVKRLPVDERSVIIRSVFRGPASLPVSRPGSPWRSTQLVQNVETLVREHDAGRVRSYEELVLAGSSVPR